MNLYRIWQVQNNGYDTFDSAVVVAASEEDAKKVHPCDYDPTPWEHNYTWADSPDAVFVEYVGIAANELSAGTIICASFNAG